MRSGTDSGAAVAVLLGSMIGLSGFTLSPCASWTRGSRVRLSRKQLTSLGESGRGEIPGLFRCFRKHGQFACAKKKGSRLEYRKPLLLNSLIGCGGQI